MSHAYEMREVTDRHGLKRKIPVRVKKSDAPAPPAEPAASSTPSPPDDSEQSTDVPAEGTPGAQQGARGALVGFGVGGALAVVLWLAWRFTRKETTP